MDKKTIEVIAHGCWQKLIRMNWANVSGYIEDAINDATAAMQYEIKTRNEMIGELKRERDGWIAEANELKAKVSELNGYLEDRHKYIEELENTLGLRNRSNPDLTIDEEQKSIFDRWKDCKD